MIDGVQAGPFSVVSTTGTGFVTIDVPVQANLSAGSHTVALQVTGTPLQRHLDGSWLVPTAPTWAIATAFNDIQPTPEPG